ncbi:hypothetical protein MMC08_008602 [Hypocenomyce scalaris]|nr:hypothetical protein [Hypocenomyce scalaris]
MPICTRSGYASSAEPRPPPSTTQQLTDAVRKHNKLVFCAQCAAGLYDILHNELHEANGYLYALQTDNHQAIETSYAPSEAEALVRRRLLSRDMSSERKRWRDIMKEIGAVSRQIGELKKVAAAEEEEEEEEEKVGINKKAAGAKEKAGGGSRKMSKNLKA